MHDALTGRWGKMGLGLLRYSEAAIPAVIDREHAGKNARDVTGIPRSVPIVATVSEAIALGADTLVPGLRPPGGTLPPEWWRGDQDRNLRGHVARQRPARAHRKRSRTGTAAAPGRFIWDVRREPEGLPNGTGAARTLPCKRVLTVGTDMAVGKMTASIELDRAAERRGMRSKFLASGQIGICITGDRMPLQSGVALDAVRVDFASGAVEALMLNNGQDYDMLSRRAGIAAAPRLYRLAAPSAWRLPHASYSGASRRTADALPASPTSRIPPLPTVCQLYEAVCAAGGTQPPARVAGIALNCGHLSDAEAVRAVKQTQAETGLPTVDVVRQGADASYHARKFSEENSMTISWGIIGCGDVCEVKSGPGFQNVAGSELVAVMRRDGDKARDFAERHTFPLVRPGRTDHCSPEVNAVYIATPPGSHLDYALQCARRANRRTSKSRWPVPQRNAAR